MTGKQQMTAAEFAEQRINLPEGGRWHELHAGLPVLLEAPDDSHGTIVMNLSRELARWLQSRSAAARGYACHDVGLHVSSDPDTVYVPAVSYFDSGPLFSQTDRVVATQVPRLVIDVAGSNDRRRDMRFRSEAILDLGVELLWIPDPFKKEIQILQRRHPTMALGTRQTLEGGAVLPGFQMAITQVFAQPDWWTSSAPRKSESKPQ